MPQMMPINWILMLLFFISIFLIFLILNYYNFSYNSPKKNSMKNFYNMNNKNWKW
uniref:ATP synthase complex subunit 8 n=1 Tax=Acanthopsyche nigraplaga TaxID=1765094 RepID=A0A891GTF3_9NEOP|nr:ATP synthase F0 subunit 8 [Acanthopsyche nigraplaga]QRK25806.1 ATP synthase F0 subunit 8 [Acanthopsyche nigraplaga]